MLDKSFFEVAFNDFMVAVNDGKAECVIKYTGGPRHGTDKFHCSDCGKCVRKAILARSGASKAPPMALSIRNFNHGREIEQLMRNALTWATQPGSKFEHIRPEYGGRLNNTAFNLTGEWDCTLTDTKDNTRCLIDIKSTHENIEKYPPNDGYRHQLGAYYWLEEQKPDSTMIVYLTKQSWRVLVDQFDGASYAARAQTWFENLMDTWNKFTESGDLPPEMPGRGPKSPDWMCDPRWCQYIRHCHWWDMFKANFKE